MQLGSLGQILPLVAVLGLSATASPLAEQNPPAAAPPAAIDAAMKATGYTYKELPGFFYFSLAFKESPRTQTVYVRRAEDSYLSLKLNEVFTLIYDDPQPPTQALIQSVFQKRFTVGGLVLEAPGGAQTNWRIRYRMEHFASSTTDRLKEIFTIVASTGDSLEKELGPDKGDKL